MATPLHGVVGPALTQALTGSIVAAPGPGVRLAGARQRRPYVEAMLRATSLAAAVRGQRSPLWVDLSALAGPLPTRSAAAASALVAALQIPEVRGVVLPMATDPASLATSTAVNDGLRAGNPEVTPAGTPIGLLLSDTALLTGDEPVAAADRLEALAAPLIAHGVPVQGVALERITEPSALDGIRALVLSFDALWPSAPEQSDAIARWVRRGGSLICVGGVAQPGDSPSAFWRLAGRASALDDLLIRAGVTGAAREVRAPARQPSLPSGEVAIDTSGSATAQTLARRTVDLSPLATAHGGAVVAIEAIEGAAGGCAVRAVELRLGGRLALAFRTGSELETRFLSHDAGAEVSDGARRASFPGGWEYRFDNLPRDRPAVLSLQIAGSYRVRVRPPDAPQAALVATDPSLGRAVARVRLPHAHGLALWSPPAGATTLTAVYGQPQVAAWRANAGSGTVTVAGVDPGAITSTAPLCRWYRAIVASAVRSAGGVYHETRALTVRRGDLIGVQAFGHEYAMEGRYVDLSEPSLPIVEDPTVPAHTARLFVAAAAGAPTPRLVASSGRVRAKSETVAATCFVVTGPSGARTTVRIASGRRAPRGVRAATVLGRPVSCALRRSPGSVEVQFEGAVEGVAVRVAWR